MDKTFEYGATPQWPYHISCGGIVYKNEGDKRLYALLGRTKGSADVDWFLPKGTLESSETLEQCAVREIKEETGFNISVKKYLGIHFSSFTKPDADWQIEKTVHYFLCEYISGDSSDMDDEHDVLEWCEPADASQKLSTNVLEEQEIIARAEKYFQIFPSN